MSAMPTIRVRTESDAIAFARDLIMVVLSAVPSLGGLDVFEELPDLCIEPLGLG
jgi:hypothetical protein